MTRPRSPVAGRRDLIATGTPDRPHKKSNGGSREEPAVRV